MEETSKYGRILALYDKLCQGKVVRTEEECDRYGITDRTFYRYIDELRTYLSNCEIHGSGHKEIVNIQNGYVMVSEDEKGLGYEEVFIIIKILLGSKGLIKEEMNALIEKLLYLCIGKIGYKELKNLIGNEILNYNGPSHGKKMQERIRTIVEAINQHYLLEICYSRLKAPNDVKRVVKPIGILFSEYYFYMLAYIKWNEESDGEQSPTIYRIDRIISANILKKHFCMDNSWKFDEYQFRKQTPFMFGGEIRNLRFWYSGPSLEAIQDRIPTAKILERKDGRYLLVAQVLGNGAEMWLRGQGEYVELLY